jgi:RsiW-degrading membrane proteinase PrsW (M82 family)
MLFRIFLICCGGIVPMVIYPVILYWFDRYEKEPLGLVIGTFLWGFVPAALFALIMQIIFDFALSYRFVEGDLRYDLIGASVIAPLTEEIGKGVAVLLIFLFIRREFDSLFDGVLYGALVGFGFAAIENILYFSSEGTFEGVLFLIFLRAILFGLNHAFFTSLTGMGLAVARLSKSWLVRISAPIIGLIAAMVAHGLHNAGATLAGQSALTILLALIADWTGVVFVFIIILMSVRRERGWLVTQLKEEVRLGTISNAQYAVLVSPSRRTQVRGRYLTRGDLSTWRRLGQFYQTATELAYKKHQTTRTRGRGAPPEMIDRLRAQVTAMSREF